MPAQQNIHISTEEYLRAERESDTKSEYLNGDIFAMAGASRAHNQITSNLVVSLAGKLLERPCSVYVSDMKVRTKTRETNKYSYPDVVVTCGDESFEDDKSDVLLNPLIIIEVLSESTEAYDRGLKFFHYQLIPSLRDYLLVTQDYCRVEHYQRRDDNQWVYSEYHNLDDEVKIATLDCSVSTAEIYRRVGL
ncbi:Uma2 family endonuclease [Leucothrix pacifica]|uniref:Putative restriction endonuclease domain-containing protein n=1 Tax=Leucothrix pacifica TaxID=1247513 RepID=A0A317C9N2_9GAMM|nr:Uma2 family endonuclease [Leucothrix pacifica]PWQ95405.1 hypothetical protein DKW60_15105 [Leucothrix pacifica]